VVLLMNALIRAHLQVAKAVQLRQLNDPNAASLHGSVFASEVRQFIREELAGECFQRCRLTDSLRPFQNETAVCLRTRPEDSRDGGDQPTRSDRTRVLGVRGSEIGRKPCVHALYAVPFQTVQVGLYGMYRVLASCRLNGLARDVNRNEDPLLLQPFRSKPVFVIRPLAFGYDSPGSWLERNRSEFEFVEGKHATPFRRMPKSDGVCQHRQDTAFGSPVREGNACRCLIPGARRDAEQGELPAVQDGVIAERQAAGMFGRQPRWVRKLLRRMRTDGEYRQEAGRGQSGRAGAVQPLLPPTTT